MREMLFILLAAGNPKKEVCVCVCVCVCVIESVCAAAAMG